MFFYTVQSCFGGLYSPVRLRILFLSQFTYVPTNVACDHHTRQLLAIADKGDRDVSEAKRYIIRRCVVVISKNLSLYKVRCDIYT